MPLKVESDALLSHFLLAGTQLLWLEVKQPWWTTNWLWECMVEKLDGRNLGHDPVGCHKSAVFPIAGLLKNQRRRNFYYV